MPTIQKISCPTPKPQPFSFFKKTLQRFGFSQKSDFAPKQQSKLSQLQVGQQKAQKVKDVADGIAAGASQVAFTRAKILFSQAKNFVWSMRPPQGWKGVSTSVVQVFKPVEGVNPRSFKGMRLDFGPNVKTGGSVNWHWNQKGVSKLFNVTDHARVGKFMTAFGKVAKFSKVAGRILRPLAMVSDAYDLFTAKDKPKTATKIAAGWAGAALGAKGGAGLGAAIGTMIFPGPGTAIGGFVGGVVGGIGGYFAGSKLGEKAYDFIKNNGAKAINFVKDNVSKGVDFVKEQGTKILNKTAEITSNIKDKVGSAVSGAKEAIGGAFHSAKSWLGF